MRAAVQTEGIVLLHSSSTPLPHFLRLARQRCNRDRNTANLAFANYLLVDVALEAAANHCADAQLKLLCSDHQAVARHDSAAKAYIVHAAEADHFCPQ